MATLAGPFDVVDAVLVSAQQTLLFVLLPLLDPVDVLPLAVDDVLPARVHRAQVVRFVVNLRQFQIVKEIAAKAFLIVVQATMVQLCLNLALKRIATRLVRRLAVRVADLTATIGLSR